MADNSFKINKSVNFNPQPGLPANPVDGDFFYDAGAQTFAYFHNGSWANFDSVGIVAAQTDLTSAQFTPAIVRNSVIKVTGTGIFPHIHGISASFSAKQITLYNNSDHYITVKWESASESTANNRILTPSGGDMNIVVGEIAVFTYDIVQNRWLLVSISSQAGAQVPATTTNNGIVTLHQASATPSAPLVLSDGDINTAGGVVGLDTNRAASITPILGNTDALTLTGLGSGFGLTAKGGATGIGVWARSGSVSTYTSGTFVALALSFGDPRVSTDHPAIWADGGSSTGIVSVSNLGLAAAFKGGANYPGVIMEGGSSSGGSGGISYGTGVAPGFVAVGLGSAAVYDVHLTNGTPGLWAVGGAVGGDGAVATGVGDGWAGIHVYGGGTSTGGVGIIADAGPGSNAKAGIFNGDVDMGNALTLLGQFLAGNASLPSTHRFNNDGTVAPIAVGTGFSNPTSGSNGDMWFGRRDNLHTTGGTDTNNRLNFIAGGLILSILIDEVVSIP